MENFLALPELQLDKYMAMQNLIRPSRCIINPRDATCIGITDLMDLETTTKSTDSILCETEVGQDMRNIGANKYGGKIATADDVHKMMRDPTIGCNGNGLFAGTDYFYR